MCFQYGFISWPLLETKEENSLAIDFNIIFTKYIDLLLLLID